MYYGQPYNQSQGYGYNQPYQPYNGQDQLIMVSGEEGARAYPLGPNRTVPLFDKNQMYFYLKSTDGGGYGTLRRFKYEEIMDNSPSQDYVTREEFEQYKKEHQGAERISAKKRSGSSGGAGDEGTPKSE